MYPEMPISPDRYPARRSKLVQRLKATDTDTFLVTGVSNVTYLTGFTGDSSYLLIGPGVRVLISDGRYMTQLREECPELEAYIRPPKEPMMQAVAKVIKKAKVVRLGVEADNLTIAVLEGLKQARKGLEVVPLSKTVEALRKIKDADEIKAIRDAIRIAEDGFTTMRAELRSAATERIAAFQLEHTMRLMGASGAAFPPIIAVDERSALPHARPTHRRIDGAAFVLVDWGATGESGYRSDLTRLLVTGSISPKLERVYRVVLRAQRAAQRVIREGVRCCDVDLAARRVIEEAGFGKHFSHGLGHGIGLDIHEGPRLSQVSKEPLKAGMVVTLEPGIYLEGWGGVRIEDDCLVTRQGCEVLTSLTKELAHFVVP
jgi:Xaa-Pro aminopeptidase